jgi:lipopolysaccharide biosynthesis glycosyltransferase
MKTKIVYVVTSDETDVYLEQALLSVFSLRRHNPNAFVELVVDQDTDATIVGKRGEILKYIDHKVVVNIPEEYNKLSRSRWLKTSLRQYIKGDFLYIDADTIITDDLSEIDSFPFSLGAVINAHVPISLRRDTSYMRKIKNNASEEGWICSDETPFFNGGVLFVKDTFESYDFFTCWHKTWNDCYKKYGRHADQAPLAATNEKFKYMINELSGTWNCQLALNGFLYIANAKIMHYILYGRYTHPCFFYGHDIWNEIKDSGSISDTIAKLVDDAKYSFIDPYMNISGKDLKLIQTPLFSICKAKQRVFSLFNNAAKIIQKANKIKKRIRGLL